MFQILKVTGDSLSPIFREGDYVLIGKRPLFLRSLKSGEIIVFRDPHYGVLIKRIESISPETGEIYVLGTHPDSTDSRRFGPIHHKDVIGKVLYHFISNHE